MTQKKHVFHPTITRISRLGQEIVFEGGPDLIKISDPDSKLLTLLSSDTSFSLSDFLSIASSLDEEKDLSTIFKILIDRGVLIESSEQSDSYDRYDSWLDYLARTTKDHYKEFGLETGKKAAAEFSVYVVGVGRLAETLTSLLQGCGITAINGDSVPNDPYNLCVICGDGTTEELRRLNKDIVSSGHKALYMDVKPPTIMIGPYYVPNSSACFNCLQSRLYSNSSLSAVDNDGIAFNKNNIGPGSIPTQLAAGIAANIIYQLGHGLRHMFAAGEIVEFDLSTHTTSKSRILRAPRCTTCASNMMNYTATSHFRIDEHHATSDQIEEIAVD